MQQLKRLGLSPGVTTSLATLIITIAALFLQVGTPGGGGGQTTAPTTDGSFEYRLPWGGDPSINYVYKASHAPKKITVEMISIYAEGWIAKREVVHPGDGTKEGEFFVAPWLTSAAVHNARVTYCFDDPVETTVVEIHTF